MSFGDLDSVGEFRFGLSGVQKTERMDQMYIL